MIWCESINHGAIHLLGNPLAQHLSVVISTSCAWVVNGIQTALGCSIKNWYPVLLPCSIKNVITSYEAGKRGKDCGHATDFQANCFAKVR